MKMRKYLGIIVWAIVLLFSLLQIFYGDLLFGIFIAVIALHYWIFRNVVDKVWSKLTLKILLGIYTILLATLFGLTYYANHFFPKGPKYATGEIVCQNDDRGPCGELYVEDTSHLNIPEWVKFFKKDTFLIIFGSALMVIIIGNTLSKYDYKD